LRKIECETAFEYQTQFKFNSDSSINSNEELTEKQLWLITNEYDNLLEWKSLGKHLNLNEQDLQLIESKYLHKEGLKECLYQCLLKWRLYEPENCNLLYLIDQFELHMNKSEEFVQNLKQKLCNDAKPVQKETRNIYNYYLKSLLMKKKLKISDLNLNEIQLNEKQFWQASALICHEWKTIARHLGLNEVDLIQIESKYLEIDGIRECCYQSLLLWSQKFYDHSSFEHFCLCLIKMRFNLFVKQLMELFAFL